MAQILRSANRLAAFRPAGGCRCLATQSLPPLPYDYSALEPYISGEIMELHHKKHHQTYINAFNAALEQQAELDAKNDVAGLIKIQPILRFNGGGHVNHSLFWEILTPPKEFEPPSGKIKEAIDHEFGSLDDFIAKFNPTTAAVQGSGWGWLGWCKNDKKLKIVTTQNQDPAVTMGVVPILGVDIWEHAYYLQYKNVRPDYLKAIWNIINWKEVGDRLSKAQA